MEALWSVFPAHVHTCVASHGEAVLAWRTLARRWQHISGGGVAHSGVGGRLTDVTAGVARIGLRKARADESLCAWAR